MRIYQRGEIWWYSFTINGQRYRRSAKVGNKEDASKAAATEYLRLRIAHEQGPASVVTFLEAAEQYKAQGKDQRFLAPLEKVLGSVVLKDITPDMIRIVAQQLYPGKSAATWNRQVIVPARAIINYAAESGYCPHIRVRRFPEKRSKRNPGSKQWVERFCANARTPELAAIARFMFETGARIGEAVGLTRDRLNLQEGYAEFGVTKNGELHKVWLSPRMVAEIANLATGRKVFGFNTRHGVYKPWRATVQKAGITPLTPHEAGRHGFATELIVRHGVDIPTAAKLGNWKSHRLLSETYAHAENERNTVLKIFGNDK